MFEKPFALNLSVEEWTEWAIQKKWPKYFSTQLIQWIYKKNILDPNDFTNVPIEARKSLIQEFSWDLPEIHSHLVSIDKSEKFLLKTIDGKLFEMVLMPYENRVTLCVSSQIGCRIGCTFCQTGKLGLERNLTSGEILSQILLANRLREDGKKVTNIVFMGMGEPLDNYQQVLKACRLMVDLKAFAFPMHKVTMSTSGLVPYIKQLGQDLPVRLAVSLHQADDAKRSAMMPINRLYPLGELKRALMDYPAPKRLGITFEYVMIEGENDHIEDAKKLVGFLSGIKAKVNLIPVNRFPGLSMKASTTERLRRFQAYLAERSIPAPVRYSRGQDISGGCGQLAAKSLDELNTDPRVLRRERKRNKFNIA